MSLQVAETWKLLITLCTGERLLHIHTHTGMRAEEVLLHGADGCEHFGAERTLDAVLTLTGLLMSLEVRSAGKVLVTG